MTHYRKARHDIVHIVVSYLIVGTLLALAFC